ncbi:hypothetical protein K488DRAFT_72407 [Vararia minispora EC-137]|uniref:Uncharacterized protein n=1 Tax=Vararia minispora EC-137 TaxID=1314806 RepID=A0ACB8QF20_9AGAM|nr:hypothetical protein K488DRAFT_72407 [Vararia minispora EC-137]
MQRPLALHVSALNDEEYSLFSASFADLLADDTPADKIEYEAQTVSLREARAWLRGRYADIPPPELDEALRLFAPSPGPDAVLTGNQFFALLRVVLHMRAGSKPDRNLVFEQVHPPRPAPPPKKIFEAPPRHPAPPSSASAGARSRQPSSDTPTSDTNPFHALAPLPPSPAAAADTAQLPTPRSSTNPFLSRAKTIHAPPRTITNGGDKPPPPSLPPRKPPPVIPPRASAFISPTVLSPAPPPTAKPPPPPIAPKVPHLTSALMKQSLLASKAAQNAKRADEERSQTRVLQVLRSSTAARTPSPGASSASDERPQLPPRPRRRQRSPPPHSASSVYSFEQVAAAALPLHEGRRVTREPLRRSPEASRSPERPTTDFSPPLRQSTDLPSRQPTDLPLPPPRHPDRTSKSEPPPSPRLGRSKSMHHTPPPPLPPTRRRRPESVQLASPRAGGFSDSHLGRPTRHASVSVSVSSPGSTHVRDLDDASPLGTFQRTLAGLGPRFDAARYKAEAGLSRRGFVPGVRAEGGERLVMDSDDGESGVDESDGEELEFGDAEDVRRRARERERVRDEMKWPAGEGWRPLG